MPAAQTEPQSITNRIFDYLKKNPRKPSTEIAAAIGGKANSIASMTTQLTQSGALVRVPAPDQRNKNGGPIWLYEVGDSARKYKGTVAKEAKRKTALSQVMANETKAKAKEVIAKVNGRHPTMAEKLDEAISQDEAPVQAELYQPPEYQREEWDAAQVKQGLDDIEAGRTADAEEAIAQLELANAARRDETRAAAQEALESYKEDLRRELLPEIREELREELRQEVMQEVRSHLPSDEPYEAPEPPPPPPAPLEDGEAVEVPLEVSQVPRQMASLLPIYKMINTVAQTMVAEVLHQFNLELTSQVAEMTERLKKQVEVGTPSPEALAARVANAAMPIKKRLPTVLIVGLLPGQAGMISQEFSDCFDLRFWKDEAMEMLKHNAKNADFIVTFTSKIGHSAEELMKSMNLPIIRCSGGMSMLRSKLTALYVKASDEKEAA